MSGISDVTTLQTISLIEKYPQPERKFEGLPIELQLVVFGKLSAKDLMVAACVCKKWQILAGNSNLWKKIALPLVQQISSIHETSKLLEQNLDWKKLALEKMRDPLILIYSQLKLEENLGPEIFEKIQTLEIWQGSLELNEDFSISNLELQTEEDDKNHFFKKIVNEELILIFITTDRLRSRIYRFHSSFNPDSFEEDQYLDTTYCVGEYCQFFLSKNDKKKKRDMDLSFNWNCLKEEFSDFFELEVKEPVKKPAFTVRTYFPPA